jgi:hypothetical protein
MPNCLQCDSQISNACIYCSAGFYASEGVCLQCQEGCAECISALICLKALPHFFIPKSLRGAQIYLVKECKENCKNCAEEADNCIDCADGYFKAGIKCIAYNHLKISIVFKFTDAALWNNTWSMNQKKRNALKYWELI